MAFLEINNLTKYFGGLIAVSRLDFEVRPQEIFGLIGPNGAGKTTIFNLIVGVHSPNEGNIVFNGVDITGLKPSIVAQKGVGRTFQIPAIFESKTVFENLYMAFHLESDHGFWGAILNTPSRREKEKNILRKARELLEFVGLSHIADTVAKNIPHGYRKSLGLAMALAISPKLLLLDEPVGGMTPEETQTMMGLISALRDRGITILLVEHNLKAVMSLCERIVVINFGRKIAEGSPDEIQGNQDVIEAYLGKDIKNAN